MKEYLSEEDLDEVISAFENGTIAREDWHHAEHLIVAHHYVLSYGEERAIEMMRSGIFKLLAAFGVDLEKEMPYHETLTVFWITEVVRLAREYPDLERMEFTRQMLERFDKDYPLKFYSRELLFSDAARATFVAADRTPDFSV